VSIGFFGYIYVLLQTQFNSFTWKKSKKIRLIVLRKLCALFVLFHSGWHQLALRHKTPETKAEDDCAFEENRVLSMEDIMTNQLRVTIGKQLDPRRNTNHGSFYLRMGAIGNMKTFSIRPASSTNYQNYYQFYSIGL
jgi:hypothetical protein